MLECNKVSRTSPSQGAQQECNSKRSCLSGASIIGLSAVFIANKMLDSVNYGNWLFSMQFGFQIATHQVG